jgi:hypothetical protein
MPGTLLLHRRLSILSENYNSIMGLPITGQVRQQITSDRRRIYLDLELQRDRACVLHRSVA